ncbi:Asp23/Gls24 family envelope stress response protein [Petroclostridium sp. X23]|uniref:Asp23/Gls24 family envelope stress response protein n=1 Tax=Petroclostridium sp. X23 TaxID=3045146 RepID=UPI0024AC88A1|nr:Asp23/Gls24 family envelope stress response protein [Petroclostridium sp. X23]WHH59888.1 Asp23/Gls24 family envelope stress response protein [Petroclostridium sp. X23]
MAGRLENDHGNIIIPAEVIANMAGMTATQCYGVVGMASRNTADGLVSLLKKEALNKGIKVTVEAQYLTIDLHIIVEYGVNISAICENIVNNVRYSLESATGLKVKKINIYVESMRVEE